MSSDEPILRLAVPTPLSRPFDYLPPADCVDAAWQPGQRLKVPFGRGYKIALLLEIASESELPRQKLRRATVLLDPEPILPEPILRLARWASRYYHYPIGEVLQNLLPVALREGESPEVSGETVWRLSEAGGQAELKRAPKQERLLDVLKASADGLSSEALEANFSHWRAPLKILQEKGLVLREQRPCLQITADAGGEPAKTPSEEQRGAIEQVAELLGSYRCALLEGVTGSGKTEVYLQLIERVLARGEQVLLLVPEISLTPQTLNRFARRFAVPIALLHSALTDRQRLCAWSMAALGEAKIVIGTRSALFTPLAKLGLIIVDEEHDSSFKQQEGFRYHGRDLAIVRASQQGVPILLGSATPSLESLFNARSGNYLHLHLTRRAAGATAPRVRLIDLRAQKQQEGLAPAMQWEIERHLNNGGQVLLFLNRRGFAPVLLCHACGWIADCPRCDAHTTFHHHSGQVRCHHCGYERPRPISCPNCGESQLIALGQGTERVENALMVAFPQRRIVRIDRDTTRRKGTLEAKLASVKRGEAQILIGTQMLAKGHHFPDVTLVGILDVDQGLFSADFRATEQLAQLVIQVAGRAGRAERPGEVLLQTHQPDHPLLRQLVSEGYSAVAESLLAERRMIAFPPYARLAIVRAEAQGAAQAQQFLQQLAEQIDGWEMVKVSLLGPVAAPMERRQGRYRAQLLLRADTARELQPLLQRLRLWLESCREARKLRWSLDVDPLDLL